MRAATRINIGYYCVSLYWREAGLAVVIQLTRLAEVSW